MVKVERTERVRLLLRDGWSIRGISRELQVSRRVVRRARQTAEPAGYGRVTPRSAPQLERYKSWIEQILREDREKPRKQRHSASTTGWRPRQRWRTWEASKRVGLTGLAHQVEPGEIDRSTARRPGGRTSNPRLNLTRTT